MKKNLMILLVICMLLSSIMFSPAALAEDWSLPEGTPMFEPGWVMELDFGTFTVLDAGFAKKVELAYTISSWTNTKNGVTEEHNDVNEYYHTAEDGTALFAVKGVLQNTSGETFSTKMIHPEIHFGDDSPFSLDAFPAVQMIGDGTMSPGWVMDLEPGMSINVDFACTVPAQYYHSDAGILFSFAGADLSFQRSGLQSYVSMGFEEGDGEITEDVTLLIDEEKAAAEQMKTESELPHIDELIIEDASLDYNKSSNSYLVSAKVRNLDYPIVDGKTLVGVIVKFRLLDANGEPVPANRDRIDDRSSLHQLRKGEAAWVGTSHSIYPINIGPVDKSDYISFESYDFLYADELGGALSKSISGVFSEPRVFALDGILPGHAATRKAAEFDSIAVDHVSVTFMEELPSDVTNSMVYRAGTQKDYHLTLNDSETYAAIHFSITNMTTREIILADTHGDFLIELVFNNGFSYSSTQSKASIILAGNETAVMEERGTTTYRIGDKIALPPLVTYDVVAYIPCAKLVATMTDKPLVVSFHTTQTGDKQIDVKVR